MEHIITVSWFRNACYVPRPQMFPRGPSRSDASPLNIYHRLEDAKEKFHELQVQAPLKHALLYPLQIKDNFKKQQFQQQQQQQHPQQSPSHQTTLSGASLNAASNNAHTGNKCPKHGGGGSDGGVISGIAGAIGMGGGNKKDGDKSKADPKEIMKKRRERAICIDRVSRVIFPSTFILLNIIYWLMFSEILDAITSRGSGSGHS